ncbi:hypothetical protein M9H77_31738 [Catharanthus roseus]|uniref:Uncharacterized protein n=1 Tax=Catharanthus roseus TaxID=4058 RepID=A0ACC0A1A5_CATRO|nr:hypothetical protein M9H77_31738 [Catharanthus roseus]
MANFKCEFLGLTTLISFLLLTSPAFAQEAKPAAKLAEVGPSKTVTSFCNQRRTTTDRAFCIRVFKSNPISSSAPDNIALLKIAIDLTVGNSRKTLDFIQTLSNSKDTKAPLMPVLQECISGFENSIKQLELITQDLEDDPPMASYDARMANEQLDRCQDSLKTSKIPQNQITSRYKIAAAYGKLVEEISVTV